MSLVNAIGKTTKDQPAAPAPSKDGQRLWNEWIRHLDQNREAMFTAPALADLVAVIPQLCILEVSTDGRDFAFRYVGATAEAASDRPLAGRSLSEAFPETTADCDDYCDLCTAIATDRPHASVRYLHLPDKDHFIEESRLLLPLGSDGSTRYIIVLVECTDQHGQPYPRKLFSGPCCIQ